MDHEAEQRLFAAAEALSAAYDGDVDGWFYALMSAVDDVREVSRS